MTDSLLAPNLAEIRDEFLAVEERSRLQLLLEFSDELPDLPERYRDHPDLMERVLECQAPVFFFVEVDEDGIVHLFTGDSLFPGGVGNTQGDAARFRQLMDDVEERIFARFPDDAYVHPGHGDSTTLGAERGSLAAWRARGW